MSDARDGYPDVTGTWFGAWWFESEDPEVVTGLRAPGVLTFTDQNGGRVQGEATARQLDARVRFRILGTVETDGYLEVAFQREVERAGVDGSGFFSDPEVSPTATGEVSGEELDLVVESRIVGLPGEGGRSREVALLRFRGRRGSPGTGSSGSLEAISGSPALPSKRAKA